MADLTIHNLRPRLEERLRRVADLQGFTVDEVATEALSIGVERYVNKPIDVHFLADAITKVTTEKKL